jgi:membrane protein
MAFFAVLTLVPSTIAVGAMIGASRPVLGPEVVDRAEQAAVTAVRALMGPELANTVIAPFVHAQLTQANGGVALGSLLIAWWLSGRLFEATGHALDACYSVEDGRHTIVARMLALAFGLASVVVVTATIEMMVTGPLGDPDSGPAQWVGLGDAYTVAWQVVRWPVLFAIVVGFLLCLYRFSANVRHTYRQCLPGAVLGAALWILAAVGFRLSAPLGLHSAKGLASDDPSVTLIGQSVNAVVATVVWAYFASIAILMGGELNSFLRARRAAAAAAIAPPAPAPLPPQPVPALAEPAEHR